MGSRCRHARIAGGCDGSARKVLPVDTTATFRDSCLRDLNAALDWTSDLLIGILDPSPVGSMQSPQISVVTPSESFGELWPDMAEFAGARLERASTVGEIRFLQQSCGVLVAAGGVEDCSISILRELAAAGAPESVVVGSEKDYRLVAAILREGATNYYAFPDDVSLCRSWMADRIQRHEDRLNGERFAADERNHFDFSKMIGSSPALRLALQRAARVIPMGNSTILICGETGTGKELLARAIHYNGRRATGPFVEINCSALPENLLEAELFGYEAGAFTDARIAKPGLIEVAHEGTLFLDEIGDLSATLQAKLLRVLEEKRVRRLGSVREVDIDLRVVAATHIDLQAAVQEGRFREDLYYRLNVVPIRLPALRDRGEDVLQIAEHFLDRFSRQYELHRPAISADVRRVLKSHRWPGNIRELRNSIERAVLLGDGRIFTEDLLPEDLTPNRHDGPLPFPAPLKEIEEAAAQEMVKRCKGNKSEAAKVLGISRKHLYTLLKRGGGDGE